MTFSKVRTAAGALLGAAALGAAALLTAGVPAGAAATDAHPAFVQARGEALPPIGWVQFCRDYGAECLADAAGPAPARLDERSWRDLVRVNAAVNAAVEPVTDQEHWGAPERWDLPLDGRGDCEDYALEKRRRLVALGWSRGSLLVTVVRDKKGDGHAVLTARTDRGDLVLDNQAPRVLPWNETGYRFVKRQTPSNPNAWESLGEAVGELLVAERPRTTASR